MFDRLFPPEDVARMPGGLIETSSLVLLRGLLAGSDRLALLSARQARIELDQGVLALAPFRDADRDAPHRPHHPPRLAADADPGAAARPAARALARPRPRRAL